MWRAKPRVLFFYVLFLIRRLTSFLSHVLMLMLLLFMKGQYPVRVPKSAFPWKKEAAFHPHPEDCVQSLSTRRNVAVPWGRQAGDKGDGETNRAGTDSSMALECGQPAQPGDSYRGQPQSKPDHRHKTGLRSVVSAEPRQVWPWAQAAKCPQEG